MDEEMKVRQFSIEQHWKDYVRRGGVPEEQMSLIQAIETKRAFYGGFGQALITMRNDIGDIDNEDEAIAALNDLLKQVSTFWENQDNG